MCPFAKSSELVAPTTLQFVLIAAVITSESKSPCKAQTLVHGIGSRKVSTPNKKSRSFPKTREGQIQGETRVLSRELTYNQKSLFEDDFPFPKVGYVNSLEGNYIETLRLS